MINISSRRWTIVLLLAMSLLVSLGCLSSTSVASTATQASNSVVSTATPEASDSTIESNMDFGPGSFNLPDTSAGLADLSSYKAMLVLSFDGTRDGATEKWTKTYVLLTAQEPPALQMTIEKTGDLPDLEPVLLAEADGVAYEQRGENSCSGTVIDPGYSLRDKLAPAGYLSSVIGADEAGTDTVNGVAANHYTFDERSFGQVEYAKSTGEVWVASDGGYVVRYLLTTEGNADYFGEGIEGTLTWDYELTDINQAVTLILPDDCPSGMVVAPLMPDASNILNMPGLIAYDISAQLADVAAFYQQQIPVLGWVLDGDPVMTETTAMLDFTQGDQLLSVIITSGDAASRVQILLENSEE